MPGSTTLGPGHGVDSIDHEDARRLAGVMARLHVLLADLGTDGLSDAQAAALAGDAGLTPEAREELTAWTARVARVLDEATSG